MRSVSIIHVLSSPLFATLQHGLSYFFGPVKCQSNDDFVVEHSQRILRLSRQASYCTSSVRQIRVRAERDFRSMWGLTLGHLIEVIVGAVGRHMSDALIGYCSNAVSCMSESHLTKANAH